MGGQAVTAMEGACLVHGPIQDGGGCEVWFQQEGWFKGVFFLAGESQHGLPGQSTCYFSLHRAYQT